MIDYLRVVFERNSRECFVVNYRFYVNECHFPSNGSHCFFQSKSIVGGYPMNDYLKYFAPLIRNTFDTKLRLPNI